MARKSAGVAERAPALTELSQRCPQAVLTGLRHPRPNSDPRRQSPSRVFRKCGKSRTELIDSNRAQQVVSICKIEAVITPAFHSACLYSTRRCKILRH